MLRKFTAPPLTRSWMARNVPCWPVCMVSWSRLLLTPAKAEKDHLRLLGCVDLCTQNRYTNKPKQDREEATAAIVLHLLFSDSFATAQWGMGGARNKRLHTQ